MNRFGLLFLLVLSIASTSCINIIEEMFLNRDGSGKYALTLDLSEFLNEENRKMLESFGDLDEDNGEDMGDEYVEEIKPSKKSLADIPEYMDSIIYLKDLPQDQKGHLSDPDFYDKVAMRIHTDEANNVFEFSFMLDFEELSDIDYFYQNLGEMFNNEEGGVTDGLPGSGGLGLLSGVVPSADMDNFKYFTKTKKSLTRYNAPKKERTDEEKSEMTMLKMFLGGGSYKTIYHLPGKVKKNTNGSATIDGKDVIIEAELVDVIDGKSDLSTIIKFK